MQIVIDIDDNLYTRLFDNGVDNYDDAVDMAKAIRKGKPLPDDATNGDVIKAICPMWINYHDTDIELIINNKDWNALYNGGGHGT